MLPSLEAFLSLWDEPPEYVKIECEQTYNEFVAVVVVDAPGSPPLAIRMIPLRTGEA